MQYFTCVFGAHLILHLGFTRRAFGQPRAYEGPPQKITDICVSPFCLSPCRSRFNIRYICNPQSSVTATASTDNRPQASCTMGSSPRTTPNRSNTHCPCHQGCCGQIPVPFRDCTSVHDVDSHHRDGFIVSMRQAEYMCA